MTDDSWDRVWTTGLPEENRARHAIESGGWIHDSKCCFRWIPGTKAIQHYGMCFSSEPVLVTVDNIRQLESGGWIPYMPDDLTQSLYSRQKIACRKGCR